VNLHVDVKTAWLHHDIKDSRGLSTTALHFHCQAFHDHYHHQCFFSFTPLRFFVCDNISLSLTLKAKMNIRFQCQMQRECRKHHNIKTYSMKYGFFLRNFKIKTISIIKVRKCPSRNCAVFSSS